MQRSLLFVPGNSLTKMQKAAACGADALILDLEDSVAEVNKAEAREIVAGYLRESAASDGPELWVRINPISTPHYAGDIEAIVPAKPFGFVLPKPDSADDLKRAAGDISTIAAVEGSELEVLRILPIASETPISIFRMDSYVNSGPELAGLTWGAEDLSAAVGAINCRTETGALTPLYDMARSLCVAAAAAAGVDAIETVYPDFRDLEGLREYAKRGRRDGFVGMMAIHPSQVSVINEVFTPDQAEVDYAQRVVALFLANPGAGTLGMDGKMLDAPHLTQARRILAKAKKSK
jgi:citrate lyase subunit beta/citryl-CoA lyase